PEGMAAGSYFLIASHREDFSESDNQLSLAEVWVSKLALITRSQQTSGQIGGLVLDAQSGQPIAGANVRGWQYGNRNQLSPISPVNTDAEGKFVFPAANRNRVLLHVAHGDQQLSSANYLGSHVQPDQNQVLTKTQFFT